LKIYGIARAAQALAPRVALSFLMNYPAAELRGIKMNFYLINPDAEHRGILLIKINRY
jgi:hypothetical protein